MTQEQKQAYDELMQIITEAQDSFKKNGKVFSQDDNDRYNKVALLCISLFKGNPTNAHIKVDKVSSKKPFVGVTVYMDTFELNVGNKEDFIELVNLADEIIFYGDEENFFHMTFYVKDKWIEYGM